MLRVAAAGDLRARVEEKPAGVISAGLTKAAVVLSLVSGAAKEISNSLPPATEFGPSVRVRKPELSVEFGERLALAPVPAPGSALALGVGPVLCGWVNAMPVDVT